MTTSKSWVEIVAGFALGLTIGLVAAVVIKFPPPVVIEEVIKPTEDCQEICVKGFLYLSCPNGVVQLVSEQDGEVTLVRCDDETQD